MLEVVEMECLLVGAWVGPVGSAGVFDDWASKHSFFDGVSPALSSFSFCGTKPTPDPWSDLRVGSIPPVMVLGVSFDCACLYCMATLC